jgi:hypothetical protein
MDVNVYAGSLLAGPVSTSRNLNYPGFGLFGGDD